MNSFFLSIFLVFVASFPSMASEPLVWSLNSRSEVIKGDARGVSIDANGTIRLAPKLTEIFKTEQPYIWSTTSDSAGNIYLGTGGEGRIFKVGANGTGTMLTDLAELNVSALAVGRSGELFAATSPDGRVYRVDGAGKAEVYFDPKEKYIWSMAAMGDGSLVIGTGESGKIYRVRTADAPPQSSLLFDTSETHIVSLATDAQGNIYAGTDSNGVVMRFGTDGKPFGVLDSPLREIHQLAIGPDGSVYALAIGESVAAAPTSMPTVSPEIKTVSANRPAAAAPEPPQKSRYDLTGAKSAVYRILPDGASDVVWSSQTVTGFSLFALQTGGVLIGTSDKGRVFSVANDGRETLALQSDAGQISTIRSVGSNVYATSSNQGRLFRIGETAAEGTYDSPILDAKSTAAWGRIWWNSVGNVQIQTRSGNTERADETWSSWTTVSGEPRGGQVLSPKARYLQWRAVLKTGGPVATLNETSVAFLPRNIAPEVLAIQSLPTNIALIANPAMQIDPNIELSGLDPAAFGLPSVQVAPRRAYQRAAKAFQWTAEDRNGDKLVYDVYYKEMSDADYKPLRKDIAENFLTIDGQSLADGRYTLKIAAKDIRSNPAGQFLTGERITEPFEIDNSAPVVDGASEASGAVVFTATDKASYINAAEYSINGGLWMTVFADDGIADSPRERFTIRSLPAGTGEIAVTLRVFDSNGNAGNARVVIRR